MPTVTRCISLKNELFLLGYYWLMIWAVGKWLVICTNKNQQSASDSYGCVIFPNVANNYLK